MLNYSTILEKFRGLIGFRKSYILSDRAIDDDLQLSDSGIFVNDLHDLFTIKNFDAIVQGADNLVNVQPYNNSTTYKKGDVVKDTELYVSLVKDNIGNARTDTSKWKKTTLLSQFLIQKYDYAVSQVIQKLFSLKKDYSQSKEILQRVALFDSLGGTEIEKSGSFVGYQIDIKSLLLANTIKRIGIQLKKAQSITVYLYHSSATAAIATKVVEYTNVNRFQWFDVADFILKKTAESYEDGYFTIGYFESDLDEDNKAVNAKVNFGANYNCGTCNYKNIQLIDLWSQYFNIAPVKIQSQFLSGQDQNWTFDNAIVYEEMNWGLNMVFSVECDFTDFIISNKSVLIPALSEQLRIVFLNSIVNTQRRNQDAIEAATLASFALEKGYFDKKLQKYIENASFDLSDVDSNCLPCQPLKQGIRHDVVW
jgi:hypothetical protein